MIVSFTGHREIDEGIARYTIRDMLESRIPERAIVGGAAGADTLAAEVCYDLDLPYVMALPHEKYAEHYKLSDDPRWLRTFRRAEDVLYVVQDKPWHWSANFKRNEWMVDNSQLLGAISKFDPFHDVPDKGGTAHCVRYAHKVHREIDWLKCE